MDSIFDVIFRTGFIHTILRVSTPIIFAGLAAVYSEKSGVINVAIEGLMLISAFICVIFSSLIGDAILALLIAVIINLIIIFGFGFMVLKLSANSILVGLGINVLAQGGTVFGLYVLTGSKGNSIGINSLMLPTVDFPIIKNVPIIGEIFSGHNLLTYVAILAVILSHILLFKTRIGIKIRAAGENPESLNSVGVKVNKTRYISLMISSICATLGGAFLSMGYMNGFTANMTSGRGFIGIAANAMGNQLPLGTFLASLLFGAADGAASSLQILNVPAQFIQMIPYITTILGISIYSIIKTRKMRGI